MPESPLALPLQGDVIAKYFFHLHNGAFVADREGVDLADWQAASDYAVTRAGDAVRALGAKFWKGEHLRVVVTDGIGTALFELRLSGHLPLDQNVLGPIEPIVIN